MNRFSIAICLLFLGPGALADTVLVTGSNRGIGLEFVTQYAADGWDVIATSRSPADDDDLQQLARTYPNVTIETLDVTDPASMESCVATVEQALGPIDILINNAGMNIQGNVVDLDAESLDAILNTNLRGPL